ncbi:phosphotransferase family protein [Blastococcus xanthinilyticus]|uniref:Phosphotransferase family enzyme n=1 Tax=Blastococcus xanthinilyticus TaxID=1564164 RepID=A0A5S5CST4_9ACTN|nr:aminoglycoside phosphotransferase family protein [Blastococcus xanthinilyticus]TYP86184.1 phosphotransferase family enzyme [Blastococcus xanthinilyticus]
MSAARIGMAVAAARAVAAAHGLATEPHLLQDGINVVLHLRPAPVVARVLTLTRELRPDAERHAAREVALAGALAAAGAAVVPPSAVLPPGPHRHQGVVLSFWTHVEVLPEAPGPAEVAAALADLHGVLGAMPVGGRPLATPLDDLASFLRRGAGWGVPERQLAAVAGHLERLLPRLAGPAQVLHGDAHPGNLLATPGGWCWTDLEDTCSGPREWDLACLRATSRLDGRAALDALGAPDDAELAPWLELRRLHAAAWTRVAALGHPALRSAADARLAEVSGEPAPPGRG